MRFSIIIPTFNRANLLDQAILSALAQTHTNREILIVNDGSSDHTAAVASKYGSAIRYLSQENQGKSAALNRGITATQGDAIIVLDDDDLFPTSALANHAEALEKNPGAAFSYGRYLRFKGLGQPSTADLDDQELVPRHDPRRLVIKLMENDFLPNPTWAVRKQAILEAGPYDERLYRSQDFDMILRLARRNEGIFINYIVCFQKIHASLRGPSWDQSFGFSVIDKWIKYDQLIFETIDQQWSLSDFRPMQEKIDPSLDDRLLFLQKGVVLFIRKLYSQAVHSLGEQTRLAHQPPTAMELKIATGLFGCRYGIADLASDGTLSTGVAGWLRAANWPPLMRMALASQIRWRVRTAMLQGEAQHALALSRFLRSAFGLATTLAVLGSRYDAGIKLWKADDKVSSTDTLTSIAWPKYN